MNLAIHYHLGMVMLTLAPPLFGYFQRFILS